MGFLFLIIAFYGSYSTYRVLRYKELYRYYPSLSYRKKEGGYSEFLCYLTGVLSIPVIGLVFVLAFNCIWGS